MAPWEAFVKARYTIPSQVALLKRGLPNCAFVALYVTTKSGTRCWALRSPNNCIDEKSQGHKYCGHARKDIHVFGYPMNCAAFPFCSICEHSVTHFSWLIHNCEGTSFSTA